MIKVLKEFIAKYITKSVTEFQEKHRESVLQQFETVNVREPVISFVSKFRENPRRFIIKNVNI